MAGSFPPLHEISTGSFIVPFSPQRHRVTESQSSLAATKLKSFAFSLRASRLRGESPAQGSPRSREEREDFAKKNPFLPAKDLRVSSSTEQPGRNQNGSHRRDFCFLQQTNSEVFGPLRLTRARTREKFFPSCKGFSTLYYGLTRKPASGLMR